MKLEDEIRNHVEEDILDKSRGVCASLFSIMNTMLLRPCFTWMQPVFSPIVMPAA